MSLDIRKVFIRIKNLESNIELDKQELRFNATLELLNKGIINNDTLIKKILEAYENKKANFTFAIPDYKNHKSFSEIISSNPNFKDPHIVISSDGSQIFPSHHEISQMSLINIGIAAIPYYRNDIPLKLFSEPFIYESVEELYGNNFDTRFSEEDLISYERTLKECEFAVDIAKIYAQHNIPTVVLLDGTLIHWHIEKFSSYFIENFIQRFSASLYELKKLNIPLISFISNSRSNDIINMLKIFNCPFSEVDCKKHCGDLNSKKLPCNPIPDYIPILDRNLIFSLFKEKKCEIGSRTITFKSISKVLDYYPEDLKISFFYIHTGDEVARVELPQYVLDNPELLKLVQNTVALQCKVGFGYPVTLSEAHLQAVVNKKDRDIFFDVIKKKLLEQKKNTIKLSNKELKKRITHT